MSKAPTQILMQRAILAARKTGCGVQIVNRKIIFVDNGDIGETLKEEVAKEELEAL